MKRAEALCLSKCVIFLTCPRRRSRRLSLCPRPCVSDKQTALNKQ